jgi:hypothetical protein
MECTSTDLVPYSLLNHFSDSLTHEERHFDIGLNNKKLVRIKQGWKNDKRGGTTIGFGASVYNSSIALMHIFKNRLVEANGKSFLELGCGTGFLSVCLSFLGLYLLIIYLKILHIFI